MSANAIWFEKKDNRFYFDGCPIRIEKLGRMMANALVTGERFIEYADISVTVNYVEQMLRWTGKHGWFFDITDITRDHSFDPNRITPGTKWEEARELTQQARELFREAASLRRSRLKRERNRAPQFEQEARQLMAAAKRTLMPGIS